MLKVTTVALCLLLSSSVLARTWTSAGGKHKRKADLVRVDGKDVILANEKGKELRVPIRRLSLSDRQFIKKWLATEKERTKDQASEVAELSLEGQVFGKPFTPDDIRFQNGVIKFRSGKEFFADQSISVFLFLDEGESIGGKRMRVTPKSGFGSPHIHVSSRDSSRSTKHESVMRGYSMNLRFSKWQDDKVTARIQLSVPELDTKLSGSFQLDRPVDPLALPTKTQLPYAIGRMQLRNIESPNLKAGYIGEDAKGKTVSNLAGSVFDGSETFVSSTTHEPRTTTIFHNKKRGLGFQHVKLEPGRYFFYVNWNKGHVEGEWVDVDEDSKIKLTMKFDAKKSGSLEVEVPGMKDRKRVTVIPLEFFEDVKNAKFYSDVVGLNEETMDEAAFFDSLRPGKYRVVCKDREAVAVVKADDVETIVLK